MTIKNYKVCGKCEKKLPATTEYYHKDKQGKHGLHSQCKECRLEQRKQRYEWQKKLGLTREYYEENRSRHLVQALKKRGYKHLTVEELEEILNNFKDGEGNHACPYCDRKMEDEYMIQFDHIVPYSEGGADILTNLMPVCKYCNRSKMSDDFSEWYRNQYFYNKRREQEAISYLLGRRLKKFYKNDYRGKAVENY